jgi:hypothetical protein
VHVARPSGSSRTTARLTDVRTKTPHASAVAKISPQASAVELAATPQNRFLVEHNALHIW